MLIEFSVANFRSLRDRQTFSMVKAKGNELLGTNTFEATAAKKFNLLRSAAIYGPNASGKSNLLGALHTMQEIVLKSAHVQPDKKIPVIPFFLTKDTRAAPSEFEVIFIADKVRYQYGFSATVDRIHEEWLLAYPKGRPQRWFGRQWNEQNKNYDWELGANLTGDKQLWQKATRPDALFLATAILLNSEQLKPIYDWFDKTLHMANIGWKPDFSAYLYKKNHESVKEFIINFIRVADPGIEDIFIEPGVAELPQWSDIRTVHRNSEGGTEALNFSDESAGTRKLFAFAGPWLETLNKGYVLFIDELNTHLHPGLVKFLVRYFHSSATNPENAQLIFTTHETSILNQEIFRRDQIWFCDKGEEQATTLYPLTDYSPRKGRENLELSYLSGCYGAVPYVGPSRADADGL